MKRAAIRPITDADIPLWESEMKPLTGQTINGNMPGSSLQYQHRREYSRQAAPRADRLLQYSPCRVDSLW